VSRGDLEAAIDGADWEHFRGPEYYDPEKARRSLHRLLAAEDEAQSWKAYSDVLYGIGNDHRGSFYPAALAAVPLLVRIAVSGLQWPRFGALHVLTDLLISFGPEQGYERFEGGPVDLMRALIDAMSDAGLTTLEGAPEALLSEIRAATSDI
jgi:hypothetical protein